MSLFDPVAVLGDVLLDVVESDVPTHTYDITEMAVEDGGNVSDHMKERPAVLSIHGIIVGDDAGTRLTRIKQMQSNRELVTYTNRVIYTQMGIQSINTEHDATIGNGMKFSIQLKHVRTATPLIVHITGVPPAVATKASWMQNGGTQQAANSDKQSNNTPGTSNVNNAGSGYNGGGMGGGSAGEIAIL